MDSPVITCDIKDYIALVTMNNPPVNAQSPAVREGVTETFDRISDLPEVRVAVLTAAGRVFSAGADIKGRAGRERQPGEQWAHSRGGREMFHSIVECRKPVIGALNGPALGAGLAHGLQRAFQELSLLLAHGTLRRRTRAVRALRQAPAQIAGRLRRRGAAQ